jgi:PKD repeat protein
VAGTTDTFSSCSRDANSFLWDFGDGTTANNATATHTYLIPGFYSASLTTTGANGASARSVPVTVLPLAGIWTFKGKTYRVSNSTLINNFVEAFQTFRSGAGSLFLDVNFYNSLPSSPGTYIVKKYGVLNSQNQVYIHGYPKGSNNGFEYESTGGNGTIQTVNVTISNGLISITGSGISLYNSSNTLDTASIDFTINQLQ